ncbi:MAG TPA: ATP-binding protein [Burkholderiaceae bacterium]|jgi:hypothetical protein
MTELQTAGPNAPLSLRAVLVKDAVHKQWAIMGLVVRPMQGDTAADHICRYPSTILISRKLTVKQLHSFLMSVAEGSVNIADEPVAVSRPQGCRVTEAPLENYWMEQAGRVYEIQMHPQVNVPQQARLVAVGEPYYPDPFEAARDWLGLRQYHGSSDGSIGHIVVLMPETRAYFGNSHWSDGSLIVTIAGSLEGSPGLSVVGACWIDGNIHQLAAAVTSGSAVLNVPADGQRLELLLVDGAGTVYDFHKEDTRYAVNGKSMLALRKSVTAESELLQQIYDGEGLRTEFKEFLDLPRGATPLGEKDKLQQVLKTVVAFANTGGGTIYFGVSDSCEIRGTAEAVAKWADGEANGTTIEGYMGALRAKVRDFVYPTVALQTQAVHHNDRLIIALEVERAGRPTSLMHDGRMYVRRGSNNVAGHPADWQEPENALF